MFSLDVLAEIIGAFLKTFSTKELSDMQDVRNFCFAIYLVLAQN